MLIKRLPIDDDSGMIVGTSWMVGYDGGAPYFYNTQSETSVWELPPELVALANGTLDASCCQWALCAEFLDSD